MFDDLLNSLSSAQDFGLKYLEDAEKLLGGGGDTGDQNMKRDIQTKKYENVQQRSRSTTDASYVKGSGGGNNNMMLIAGAAIVAVLLLKR